MLPGFYVYRAKLPAFDRVAHAVLEPFLLLLVIHRKPVFYEDYTRANQHLFEEGARSHELLIFFLCAEAHDAQRWRDYTNFGRRERSHRPRAIRQHTAGSTCGYRKSRPGWRRSR